MDLDPGTKPEPPRFGVLGAVTARAAGGGREPLELGGPKLRRLLAALLMNPGQAVSLERLNEAVWYGETEPAGRTTLPSYITRLRRRLGDDIEIERRHGGYALRVDRTTVDAGQFEAAIDRTSAITDPAALFSILDTALKLWRGDAYEEFADESWALSEAQRMNEMRAGGIELFVEAQLSLGSLDRAITFLQPWMERWPYREHLRSQHMLALHRNGRRADALRSFQEFRRRLGDELGLEPSDDIRDLERRIAVDDPTLRHTSPHGRTLRSFRLHEPIGHGTYGTVYRATQLSVDREVCVKVLRPELANTPEFIKRFEVEARRVASLEHPHIVPLYDFWRDPNGVYLVMRYLRGGNLADRMTFGSLDEHAVPLWLQQLADGLDTAHRAGVVHRDVKAENVLLDGDDNAYLTDFGIAVQVDGSQSTAPADDDWTLDLQAFAEVADEVLRRVGGVSRPEVRTAIDSVVTGVHRFSSVSQFAEVVTGSTGHRRVHGSASTPIRNPYKGLEAFQETDANDFFGRDQVSDDVLDRLESGLRTAAVVGPSGSGKSSIVRAGVLPRLRAGNDRFVVTMHPGSDPMQELAAGLLEISIDQRPADAVAPGLDADEPHQGIHDAVESALPAADAELVLFIDQFEELFTLTAPVARTAFLQALLFAVCTADSRLRLILTLRADFYDRPLVVPGFGQLLADSLVTVTMMQPDELERAIVGPAEGVGLGVHAALLVELLQRVADRPSMLPLLQHTLTATFDRCNGSQLTVDDYLAAGGLEGTVAHVAETLYEQLTLDARVRCRRAFGQLASLGEAPIVRRRMNLCEVAPQPDDRLVVDGFVAARLLSTDRDPLTREPTLELAHESLPEHWPRLAAWLDEDREDLILFDRLRRAAHDWQRDGREPTGLLRGARLQAGIDWVDRSDSTENLVAEFVQASVHAAEAEERAKRRRLARLRVLLAAACVGFLGAAILGTAALQQRRRADDQALQAAEQASRADREARNALDEAERASRSARESDVRRLVAQSAVARAEDPDLAILLALEAAELSAELGEPQGDVTAALHTAVHESRLALRIDNGSGTVAVTADGATLALVDNEDESVIVLHSLPDGDEIRRVETGSEIGSLAFSPDGTWLAVGHYDNELDIAEDQPHTLTLLRVGSYQPMMSRTVSCCTDEMIFSGDGRLLLTGPLPEPPPQPSGPLARIWEVDDLESEPRVVEADSLAGWSSSTSAMLQRGNELVEIDVTTGQAVSRIIDIPNPVLFMRVSPDGSRVLVGTGGDPHQLRALDDLRLIRSFADELPGDDFGGFSSDADIFLYGQDDTVSVADIDGERQFSLHGFKGLPGYGYPVIFARSADHLIVAQGDETLVWELGPTGPDILGNIKTGGDIWNMQESLDGRRLAVDEELVDGSQVRVFDTEFGSVLATGPSYPRSSAPLSIAVNGGLTAGSTAPGETTISDINGTIVRAIDNCSRAETMDDLGRWILVVNEEACSDSDGGRVIDVATGEVLFETDWGVGMSMFGPSGTSADNLLVFQSFTEGAFALRVARLPDGELIGEYSGGDVWRPYFSSDGRHVTFGSAVSGGWAISVEEILNGTNMDDAVVLNPRIPGSTTFTVAGPRWLVTGHSGELLRFWDLETGELWMTLPVRSGNPTLPMFTRDGRYLYYTDADHVIRRLILDQDELVALARDRVQRDFTAEECERYRIVDCD